VKSKLVILDANVIIDMHRNKIWDRVVSLYAVHIPSIVASDEAVYFISRGDNQKHDINLGNDITSKRVRILEATADDIKLLKDKVTDDYFNSIDPGELEAIALLCSGAYENFKFCTGDKAAIKALTVFDLTHQGISLEKLLSEISIKLDGFSKNYSETEFKKQQGYGLQEKDFYLQ